MAEQRLQRRKEYIGGMHPKTMSSMKTVTRALRLNKNALTAKSLHRQYFDLGRRLSQKERVEYLGDLVGSSYVLGLFILRSW